MIRHTAFVTAIILLWLLTSVCGGAEPGWLPQVVVAGPARERIRAIPVVNRPYRPLHFYGNTARRIHYRGHILPRRSDLRAAWWAFRR